MLDGIDAGHVQSHVAAGGEDIKGPALRGPDGTYDEDASVELTSFNTVYGTNTAAARVASGAHVRRLLEPFDITLVDLSAATTLIEGQEVRAAPSLDDVSRTLAANNSATKDKDSYIFVVQALIGGTTDDDTTNPQRFAENGYGEIASGRDIGWINDEEGTASTLLLDDLISANRLADVIVHEAGHLLGLSHVYRTDPGGAPPSGLGDDGPRWDLYSESEVMSYLRDREDSNVISQLPMIKAQDDLDLDVLNTTPNPYGHLAADPRLGRSAM